MNPVSLLLLAALGSPASLDQGSDAPCVGTLVAPTVVVFAAECRTPHISDALFVGEAPEERTPIAGVGRLASGRLVVYVVPGKVEL